MRLVLGAGLAGLSISWHLGHRNCTLLEKATTVGGHARSVHQAGFTLDHGPHISFTKHAYVRDLFARNTQGQYHEFPIRVGNFLGDCIIDHPAQVHLWQLPEPLRSRCASDMRAAAASPLTETSSAASAPDYSAWLRQSFGRHFADALPAAYTRKYWTVDPSAMTTDWLGPRMHTPSLAEIDAALVPGSQNSGYYITTGRYPMVGGYQRFFENFAENADIRFACEVAAIDLPRRRVTLTDHSTVEYTHLFSTIPLPVFVRLCPNAPENVLAAAAALDCTQLALVDVFAPKTMASDYRWFYVYDEDKLATRIHCVESLASSNAPEGMTGIQVEVYFSRYRPLPDPLSVIEATVTKELVSLGFVSSSDVAAGRVTVGSRVCPYANVMFTHGRRDALDVIFDWLQQFGLEREQDDLDAFTDWNADPLPPRGTITMAGRFAQWKYFWTDDCVLRGRQIAASFSH